MLAVLISSFIPCSALIVPWTRMHHGLGHKVFSGLDRVRSEPGQQITFLQRKDMITKHPIFAILGQKLTSQRFDAL